MPAMIINRAPQAPPPLDARLRRSTRAAHQRTEAALLAGDWLTTIIGYQTLLIRLLHLHRHLEGAAARFPAELAGLDLPSRSRSLLLEADLAAVKVLTGAVAARTPPLPLPRAAHVLGAYYVLEGSTMGGAVVAAMVRRNLGLPDGVGTAALVPYAERTMQRWLDFKAFARQWPGTPTDVIGGAQATFACYRTWVLAPGTV